jgi:hypothetical protein
MNTNSLLPAGDNSVAVLCSVSSTVIESQAVTGRIGGGTRSHRAWFYRRIMKSPVVEPFRKVLQPLIKWTFKPHFGVRDEANGKVLVNLKPPSTLALVMSVLLAPIVLLMLLPLFLILIPVLMIVFGMAVLVPAMSGDMEEEGQYFFASQVIR